MQHLFVGKTNDVVIHSVQFPLPAFIILFLLTLGVICTINLYHKIYVRQKEIYYVISHNMLTKHLKPYLPCPKIFP